MKLAYQYLIGRLFNKLTIINLSKSGRRYLCRCVCSCGREKTFRLGDVKSGAIKNCGCIKGEYDAKAQYRKIYNTWRAMIDRCYYPKNNSYRNYGAKGVTVCEQWKNSLSAFIADMDFPPTREHTLERIDNSGNYEAGNCKWATWIEQANNRKNNCYVTYNGITKTFAQWNRLLGAKTDFFREHYKLKGMSVDEIIAKAGVGKEEFMNRITI